MLLPLTRDLGPNFPLPWSRWTSGDAAGLPMFPDLVRYDECERGLVEPRPGLRGWGHRRRLQWLAPRECR